MLYAHLCVSDFSNVISKSEIKALAEADEQEVVAEVQVRSGAPSRRLCVTGVLYLFLLIGLDRK